MPECVKLLTAVYQIKSNFIYTALIENKKMF